MVLVLVFVSVVPHRPLLLISHVLELCRNILELEDCRTPFMLPLARSTPPTSNEEDDMDTTNTATGKAATLSTLSTLSTVRSVSQS